MSSVGVISAARGRFTDAKRGISSSVDDAPLNTTVLLSKIYVTLQFGGDCFPVNKSTGSFISIKSSPYHDELRVVRSRVTRHNPRSSLFFLEDELEEYSAGFGEETYFVNLKVRPQRPTNSFEKLGSSAQTPIP